MRFTEENGEFGNGYPVTKFSGEPLIADLRDQPDPMPRRRC